MAAAFLLDAMVLYGYGAILVSWSKENQRRIKFESGDF